MANGCRAVSNQLSRFLIFPRVRVHVITDDKSTQYKKNLRMLLFWDISEPTKLIFFYSIFCRDAYVSSTHSVRVNSNYDNSSPISLIFTTILFSFFFPSLHLNIQCLFVDLLLCIQYNHLLTY